MTDPWLDPIPAPLRAQAMLAFTNGNVERFLRLASSENRLALVFHNRRLLQSREFYEVALIDAFLGARTHHRWPLAQLRHLFTVADRRRLRAISDPLPGRGPYTVYRGVAGYGKERRIRGLSWTGSPERARGFAEQYVGRLPDPAVYRILVDERSVLFYSDEPKQEQEFLVLLPYRAKAILVERIE